jgi:sulfotransferase 6B1
MIEIAQRIGRYTREELVYLFASLQFRWTQQETRKCAVLINGAPKSGTTWMLRMLSSIPLHNNVGNFRWDRERYEHVMPGDCIHGHERYDRELGRILKRKNVRVILMIRDLRDQVVSNLFHIRRSQTNSWHTRILSMSKSEGLMACIEGHPGSESTPYLGGANGWYRFAHSWMNQDDIDICIVKYEDLSTNTQLEMGRVFRFLGLSQNERLISSIINRNRFERLTMGKKVWTSVRFKGQEDTESHFRKGVVGDWRNHFEQTHIKHFKELAGEALIRLGYERDYEW